MKKFFVYVEDGDDIKRMVYFSPTERALKDKLKRKKIDYIKIKECGNVDIKADRLKAVLADVKDLTEDELEYIVAMCSSDSE